MLLQMTNFLLFEKNNYISLYVYIFIYLLQIYYIFHPYVDGYLSCIHILVITNNFKREMRVQTCL